MDQILEEEIPEVKNTTSSKGEPRWRLLKKIGTILLFVVMGVTPFIILLYTPTMINGYLSLSADAFQNIPAEEDEAVKTKMQKEADKLSRKLDALTPKGSYILINTTTNIFQLIQKGELVREGSCSTGSNVKLVKEGDQEWMFKTPKGIRKILFKTKDPVWKKPDWAFIEEGLPVPSMNHSSRYEYGVLGDYSLSLGDGYLIHGTLYQRFLGMPVTHGCVRLGDEDLAIVFKTLTPGSKVFIF